MTVLPFPRNRDYKSLLFLNGELPEQMPWEAIRASPLPMVAADGALYRLLEKGIRPHYAIGDFDHFTDPVPEGVTQHHIADQDSTDFEKCIGVMRDLSLTPALIFGIAGGELDHTLGNLHTLVKYYRHNGEWDAIDYDSRHHTKLITVITGHYRFDTLPDATISLFPFPSATLTSEGLRYPLQRLTLHQTTGIGGWRNEASESSVALTVHEGVALVIRNITHPPCLPAPV